MASFQGGHLHLGDDASARTAKEALSGASSPDALQFPKDFAPPAGCEVVPSPEAKQLAAYLLSLKADAPLYEAPFTPVMTKP